MSRPAALRLCVGSRYTPGFYDRLVYIVLSGRYIYTHRPVASRNSAVYAGGRTSMLLMAAAIGETDIVGDRHEHTHLDNAG